MIFKKKIRISTLDDVLTNSWALLYNGVKNFRHPFYKAALTTLDGDQPKVRTVILRQFSENERTLICHCDARSPKVSQISDNPNVSWLFYHPKEWIQLSFSGTAAVHTKDQVADAQWETVRTASRINYCTQLPPGSMTKEPTSGLPESIHEKKAALFNKAAARQNFAAVICRFDKMDWLRLKLTGNQRAQFSWSQNRVEASWVIP